MTGTKVSIIIPVFNAEKYLSKALKSILNQSYQNKEIIIVDDASTDNSFAIAKSFESNNCKVLQQKNAGAAVARNTGLSVATGDYIQFMDIDDFLSPGKIEKQVAALEINPGKVAVCKYVQFVSDDELGHVKDLSYQDKFIYTSEQPSEFLINLYGGYGELSFIQTNCWLIPRDLINKSGGWRAYRCPDDDGEFFARVILASKGIVYVPGVYNYYRIDNNNISLSRNASNKYLQNVLLTIDLKYNYLKKHTNNLALDNCLAQQYFEFAVYNYIKNTRLAKIAYRRYKKMGVKAKVPMLGGQLIHFISAIFGWKTAIYFKYYLGKQIRKIKQV